MTHQTKANHRYYGSTADGEVGGEDVDMATVAPAVPLQRRPSRYDRMAGSVGGLFGAHPDDAKKWEKSGVYSQKQQGYHRLAAYDDDSATETDGRTAETRLDSRSPQQRQRDRGRDRRRTGAHLPAWRRPSVKRRIEALPTFRPYFTILITLIQVGITIYTLIDGDLERIAFSTKTEEKLINDPMNRPGRSVNAVRDMPFNFFIGPSAKYLTRLGAMYTLCMRRDTALLVRRARELELENRFLCCSVTTVNGTQRCGMMDPEVCNEMGINQCTVRGGPGQCNDTLTGCNAGVALRPCCIGMDAQCIITSEENCTFYDGTFHRDEVVCRDVNCLGGVCDTPLQKGQISPEEANQWFRLFTAMCLQSGVISGVIFLGAQLVLGVKIEKQIGWLRIMLIYVCSGVGGYLVSGIFVPTTSEVGCSGAVFGLFSIRFVELIQRWQALPNPCSKLIGLLLTLIFALALGTTPYLDNFSHVGGFVFGLISSFVFVPYLTFGKFDAARKCCFVLVAILVIAGLFFFGIIIFYNTQNAEFCSWCSYINCVPYTSTFCDEGFNALKVIP